MTTFRLVLSKIASMPEFHDRVASELKFPAFYGRNLDAFWDCICDIGPADAVEIVGRHEVPRSISGEIDRYIELLCEASERPDYGFDLKFV